MSNGAAPLGRKAPVLNPVRVDELQPGMEFQARDILAEGVVRSVEETANGCWTVHYRTYQGVRRQATFVDGATTVEVWGR